MRPHLSKAAYALILVVATTFLVAAETSLKAIIDSWFSDCRIVVEKRDADKRASQGEATIIHVTLHSTGDVPNELRVGFSTNDRVLKEVRLERDTSRGNLAVHPASSKACPPELCAEPPVYKDGLNRDLKLRLAGFDSVFDFDLRVVVVPQEGKSFSVDDLEVFVHYPEPLRSPVCAVEEASFWNGLVWYEPLWRIVLLAVLFLAFSAVVSGITGLIKS